MSEMLTSDAKTMDGLMTDLKRFAPAAALVLLTFSAWGCASTRIPPSPVPCQRVALDPAPPWTASATWNAAEDAMILVDPGTRSLASYGLDGQRKGEFPLDGVAEIDYAVPMRLERKSGGYVLIDSRQVLHFDSRLALQERQDPFAFLADRGFSDGSFNDALIHGQSLYGYADFVDHSVIPPDDPKAKGTWKRGFVQLNPEKGDLDLLLELTTNADEYSSYYFYGRRPYVSEVDGKIYFLRLTDTWSVQQRTRQGLRTVVKTGSDSEERAESLYGWNGKLYVLTRRDIEKEDENAPKAPVLKNPNGQFSAELLEAMRAGIPKERQWTLHEIDPRGRILRKLRLPTTAERLRLVPGRGFWAGIEESSAPTLDQESGGTSFLFLPGSEIVAGQFSCTAQS